MIPIRTVAIAFIFALAFIPFNFAKAETPMKPTSDLYETAIVAAGCFWCIESDYDKIDGVIETISGYTGGHVENPTYKQVSYEPTGHYEALKVTYDPSKLSYADILDIFWHNHDPFDATGQFCDKGPQYRAAIFYLNDEQKQIAEETRDKTQRMFNDKIVTDIIAAKTFYDAEDYHQDYHNKNPLRYKFYRTRCGRDKRLKQVWESAQ